MKLYKLLPAILFLLLFSNLSISETYYISNNGNDNYNGLSGVYPWKTIAKLNSSMSLLKPGDAVLFERGGYFSGQINLSASGDDSNPLVFGAYGEGNNPVISGAVPVKNWTLYKNNIYKAEVNGEVKNLFVNGVQLTLARYPNSGMLKIQKPLRDPQSGFTDSYLNQQEGYWKGSIARIRTVNWAYEYTAIKNFKNGTIYFENKTSYPVQSEWGYYLDNNLNELDTAGEWYFGRINEEKGRVYYQTAKNQNINNLIVESCIYEYGVFSNSDLKNLIIRDIDFKYQYKNAIWFVGKKESVELNNCRFSGQFQIGINFSGYSKNCKINNCRFYDICGKSIYILESEKTIISNNIFVNSGMKPGYGTTGDAFGMTPIVILNSDSNHIFKNLILNSGHDGINSIGRGNVIEKNIIKNSMLLLNDGSAIKSYGRNTSNSVWRNNFIINAPGNLDGTVKKYNHIAASGIYLDDQCNNMKVYNNTIMNCGLSGINLNNGCKNNSVYGNVCYGNNIGINFYQGKFEMSGNVIENNVLYGFNKNQYSVQFVLLSGLFSQFNPGKFINNYFINPGQDEQIIIQEEGLKKAVSISQWKRGLNEGNVINPLVFSGKEYSNPKIFLNMSDDSTSILLNPNYIYKDVNNNSRYGSVNVSSWSSEILFSDRDISLLPEMYIINNPLYFGKVSENRNSPKHWFCISGKNLKEVINISAPEGFEVSLSEEGVFQKNISIYPSDDNLFLIVYARFSPESENNFYNYIEIKSGLIKSSIKVTGISR